MRWACYILVIVCLPSQARAVGPGNLARRIHDAENAVSNANTNVNRVASALANARTAAVAQAAILANASRRRVDSENVVTVARSLFAAASKKVSDETTHIASLTSDLNLKKTAAAVAQDAVNQLLAKKINLYDMSWSVSVNYNLRSDMQNAWAEFPEGLKFSSSGIESAFQGQLTFPDVNPVDLLGLSLGVTATQHSTYPDEVTKLYEALGPGERLYVSGNGLAELMSPEHFANAGVDAVVSGGIHRDRLGR